MLGRKAGGGIRGRGEGCGWYVCDGGGGGGGLQEGEVKGRGTSIQAKNDYAAFFLLPRSPVPNGMPSGFQSITNGTAGFSRAEHFSVWV